MCDYAGSKKSPSKGGKKKSSPVKAKRKSTTAQRRTPTKKDSKKVLYADSHLHIEWICPCACICNTL